MIILAVMLLSRIYNALVGGSSVSAQDAKLLANVVNELLRDERPYVQVPILLRLDGDRIVAFGTQTNTVEVPTPGCNERTLSNGFVAGIASTATGTPTTLTTEGQKISVPTGCSGNACICSSSGNKAEACHRINTANGVVVNFRGNYQGYASCLRPGLDVPDLGLPDDIAGAYTDFVIDQHAVAYFKTNDLSKNAQDKQNTAILPVIIEKITAPNNQVYIIVSPDSDRVRGRQFYEYVCPQNSEESCKGMTGANSLSGGKYCAPSLLDGTCTVQTISSCSVACGFVNEPCLCPAAENDPKKLGVATYGFCVNNQGHMPVNCDVVTRCEEYQLQDGKEGFTQGEAWSCSFDPCRVAGVGMQCQFGAPNSNQIEGFWNELRNTFSDDLEERCEPTLRSQASARLTC